MPLDLMTRLDPLRRVRCPFCFERFAACEMHLRCNDHYCKTDFARMIEDPILSQALNGRRAGGTGGAALAEPLVGRPAAATAGGAFRRHLDWMVLPDALDCPNCRQADRPAALPSVPQPPARLGDHARRRATSPSSARSRSARRRIVTVLLHELDHRVGPERGFILDPLTDEIRERYEREYHELTYGGSQFGVGEELDGDVVPPEPLGHARASRPTGGSSSPWSIA